MDSGLGSVDKGLRIARVILEIGEKTFTNEEVMLWLYLPYFESGTAPMEMRRAECGQKLAISVHCNGRPAALVAEVVVIYDSPAPLTVLMRVRDYQVDTFIPHLLPEAGWHVHMEEFKYIA
jgi:hypothetical protein